MRPIDADKIPYVEALTDTFEPSGKFYARREDISAMPTIDSVPVVRCKDCKHWTRTVGDEQWSLGDCNSFDKHLVMCNGFCAWAERRTDGSD